MSLEARIDRLHAPGLVDMHSDVLMDLYEKRRSKTVLRDDYLPEIKAGGMGVIGAAIYIEDKYLPEMALRVALGQISVLKTQVDAISELAVCTSSRAIETARAAGKTALLITMEGVEPIGIDLNLLRTFYDLGVRMIGLTHVRRTLAADGGVFAPGGSSKHGLTAFGRELVQACADLGILIDLAHINPAGFDDVLAHTQGPVSVSHSNARHYFDIERNMSDDQIREIGARGGVIGVNAVLVSADAAHTTLDRYVDHIDYMVELAGIDAVGIGFDFFERIFHSLPSEDMAGFPPIHFIDGLRHHGHARNLTRRLIERGWDDDAIAKVLHGNWRRVLARLAGGPV